MRFFVFGVFFFVVLLVVFVIVFFVAEEGFATENIARAKSSRSRTSTESRRAWKGDRGEIASSIRVFSAATAPFAAQSSLGSKSAFS
ncbi:MAG: hypothetical protein J6K20_03235 [Thermoguttaceae bacterium]|nr:hypothetical protein [Thermoguttaceae bacterium]